MTLDVRFYQHDDEHAWEQFLKGCPNATLLHSRHFLSYHLDRFRDRSLILSDDNSIVGLCPAALDANDQTVIVSHPGVTFGGIVHDGNLRGDLMIIAIRQLSAFLCGNGFRLFRYKAMPVAFQSPLLQDDVYALFRLGAGHYRCDLSSCIDVDAPLPRSSRRTRALKAAKKADISISTGISHAAAFWEILEENLSEKHGVRPTHSLQEICLLAERFPDHIQFIVGYLDGQVASGVVTFQYPGALHAQYIASSGLGRRYAAVDAVIDHCLAQARAGDLRFLSLGISTEESGRVLNQGLFKFKSEFGAGSFVHDFFELHCSKL